MKTISDGFAQRFQTLKQPLWLTHLGYTSTYSPSMEYPIAATTLNPRHSFQIQKLAHRSIIGAHNLNRMFPRAAIYGPNLYGGFEKIHHLYTEQGLRQIKALIGPIRQDSDVGKLYICCLSQAQLLIGCEFSILERPQQPMAPTGDPLI